MLSWIRSAEVRTQLFCNLNKICKESLGMLWHGRVKRNNYSHEAISQIKERKRGVAERC